MTRTIEIYTDGACRGNPGPGGWGALLISGKRRRTLHGGEKLTTNNRMELTAAIEALKALNGSREVVLHTDSKYLMDGIEQWLPAWKERGWKTAAKQPVKNQDLWQELDRLRQAHSVRWKWVKAHNGNAGNEEADALANRGIDEQL